MTIKNKKKSMQYNRIDASRCARAHAVFFRSTEKLWVLLPFVVWRSAFAYAFHEIDEIETIENVNDSPFKLIFMAFFCFGSGQTMIRAVYGWSKVGAHLFIAAPDKFPHFECLLNIKFASPIHSDSCASAFDVFSNAFGRSPIKWIEWAKMQPNSMC